MIHIRFTSAPQRYDWPCVISQGDTGLVDRQGHPIRAIVVDDELWGGGLDAQVGRYASGLYPTWDTEGLAREVAGKYLTPRPQGDALDHIIGDVLYAADTLGADEDVHAGAAIVARLLELGYGHGHVRLDTGLGVDQWAVVRS